MNSGVCPQTLACGPQPRPTFPPSARRTQAYEKSKSVKGRAQAAVYSAVIFLACRQTGYPRTFKEICASVPQAAKKVRGPGAGEAGEEVGTPQGSVGALRFGVGLRGVWLPTRLCPASEGQVWFVRRVCCLAALWQRLQALPRFPDIQPLAQH